MYLAYGLPMMKAKPKWLEIGTGPVKKAKFKYLNNNNVNKRI